MRSYQTAIKMHGIVKVTDWSGLLKLWKKQPLLLLMKTTLELLRGFFGMIKGRLNDLVDVFVVSVLAVLPIAIIAVFMYGLFSLFAPKACAMEKLGTISRNPFIGDSTSNPFSMYNNPFNPNSPRNRFGPYGNFFSPYSANNPFAMQSPTIYGHADEGYAGGVEASEPMGDSVGDGYEGSYAATGGYQ